MTRLLGLARGTPSIRLRSVAALVALAGAIGATTAACSGRAPLDFTRGRSALPITGGLKASRDDAQAPDRSPARVAQRLAADAAAVIRQARDAGPDRGWLETRRALLPTLAADRAALIGAEVTPLVTTLGSLPSKELSTDPRWAAVIATQLAERGVHAGDTVLASFSGSFPGLNIAVMAACRALSVRLVAISSVTASTWGADEPGFTWPEMEVLIARAGVLPGASRAVTVGGTRDAGTDLDADARAIAVRIQHAAADVLDAAAPDTATLEEAVARRLAVYRGALGTARPAAYVNVGGNHASLGGARAAYRHEEGWLPPSAVAGAAPASVIDAFLAEQVPVLSLLNVKALAGKWVLEATAP